MTHKVDPYSLPSFLYQKLYEVFPSLSLLKRIKMVLPSFFQGTYCPLHISSIFFFFNFFPQWSWSKPSWSVNPSGRQFYRWGLPTAESTLQLLHMTLMLTHHNGLFFPLHKRSIWDSHTINHRNTSLVYQDCNVHLLHRSVCSST